MLFEAANLFFVFFGIMGFAALGWGSSGISTDMLHRGSWGVFSLFMFGFFGIFQVEA
jgi:hypothetical protein